VLFSLTKNCQPKRLDPEGNIAGKGEVPMPEMTEHGTIRPIAFFMPP
jgi:hypothetical protein